MSPEHLTAPTSIILARAGGGGSSSESSAGSSSFRSSSSSRDHDSGSSEMSPQEALIIFGVFLTVVVVYWSYKFIIERLYAALAKRFGWKTPTKTAAAGGQAASETAVPRDDRSGLLAIPASPAASIDPARAAVDQRVREVFLGFQKAWSDMDAEAMKPLLTDDYYRRAVLELNVLHNQQRRNLMENVRVNALNILSLAEEPVEAETGLSALIAASADDSLLDLENNRTIYRTSASFSEIWDFRLEGGAWKLAEIRQMTESERFTEDPVADFAVRNGFYYDKDFGWLMMPDKGAIFNASNFGSSDINNHVIGYYRDKIVEFYTYRPKKERGGNYVVAQAILPRSYKDILVKKRGWLGRCPGELQEHSLESSDFNKKYLVCAHPEDTIGTLELLTPNFMVHIEDLTYDLSVEVVGNVLYFYTLDRRCSYDQMLQLLAWAFDEMKM